MQRPRGVKPWLWGSISVWLELIIQGEWRRVETWERRFAFSLRIMGGHRGFSAQERLARFVFVKAKTPAGWRIAGRQEGEPRGCSSGPGEGQR